MEKNNRILSALSLCRRAARLVLGFDPVKEAILQDTAKGVFVTQDVSAKSKKEIEFICSKWNRSVVVLPVCMEDVKASVGKRSGIIAVTEQGFADKLTTLAGETNSVPPQPRRNDTI